MGVDSATVMKWILEAVKLRSRVDVDPTVIHVSEVVGCLRKAFYSRTRPLTVTPANALKILGGNIHESLQEVLRRYGYETEFRVAVSAGGVKLVGHCDAYHPEKQHVLEFKTVGKLPERPYPEHVRQAQAYLTLTNSKKAYIIYIGRSDGKVKVFEVKPDKQVLRELIQRARELSHSLITREPPPPEPTHLCNYCEYKLTCRRKTYSSPSNLSTIFSLDLSRPLRSSRGTTR